MSFSFRKFVSQNIEKNCRFLKGERSGTSLEKTGEAVTSHINPQHPGVIQKQSDLCLHLPLSF